MPRLAHNEGAWDDKSAHELLFEQLNRPANKADWGGFSVEVSSSGEIKYAFKSGAFNSPRGQRIKGAQLPLSLITYTKNQIDDFHDMQKPDEHLRKKQKITQVMTSPEKSSPCKDSFFYMNEVHSKIYSPLFRPQDSVSSSIL